MIRKLFTVFSLSLALFMLGSCEGPAGRDGRDGIDGSCVMEPIDIDVPQKAWQYSNIDNNNYFYAVVQMPEITRNVLYNGTVMVYRTYEMNEKDGTPGMVMLPYVRPIEMYVGNYQWEFFTEQVDCEIREGKLIFYYTLNNFNYELDESFVPEAMQFRCSIIY